jgi:hypothetical protein
MGAEIEWLTPDKQVGVVRFGPTFHSTATEDEWSGITLLRNHGNWCYLFCVAGKVVRQDLLDVLHLCQMLGFKWAEERRNKKNWRYDLTRPSIRRKQI